MVYTVETQKKDLPLLATRETCAGKVYIVTGSNVGLGYEAAKHLAALSPSKVILAVRNLAAGAKAKSEIESSSPDVPKGVVEVWPLDLSSYDSVKAFAKKANAELDRLDCVIANAAIATESRERKEGHQVTTTVNILSPFLHVLLLLPKLKETARSFGTTSSVVFVSSMMGFMEDTLPGWKLIRDDPINKFDDTELVSSYHMYQTSKLIESISVRHFATEVAPVSKTGVVVNYICPGLCWTELDRDLTDQQKDHLHNMRTQHARTAEQGSRTLLHGAVAGKESHGKYLHCCEIHEDDVPQWAAEDKEGAKNAWEGIARELEKTSPGILAGI